MNCDVHSDREASLRCFECGGFICKDCVVNMNDKTFCKKCFEESMDESNGKYTKAYNSFWAFVFSLIPGAGQMYLGLMKKGIQIMTLFFALISVSALLNTLQLLIFGVIIWFYSFFDCFHIKKAVNEGLVIEDRLIYDIGIKGINYKYVGIGLIVVGVLAILNNGLAELFRYIRMHYSESFYRVFVFIRESTFPIAIIIIGVFVLRKSMVEKKSKEGSIPSK